jgi:hypothetical protein
MHSLGRERSALAALLLFEIPFGYWLRFRAPFSPQFCDSAGGALYVILWILMVGVFLWRPAARRIAGTVLAITCALEFLQLWHPAWLEAIRATFPGRVLLGTTFGWTDFPPYFLGAALGWLMLGAVRWLRQSEDSL